MVLTHETDPIFPKTSNCDIDLKTKDLGLEEAWPSGKRGRLVIIGSLVNA